MPGKISKSRYAPSERAKPEELKRQVRFFEENEIVKNISNAVSNMVVILNKYRQIIYANNQFLNLFGLEESAAIIGMRPGEATNCIHADNTSGGCGTSEFCRTCGAVNAILESYKNMQSVKECRIITTDKEALDLKVSATSYSPNGDVYTIFAINDISDEKRRQTLERIFFHDVLNSAGGISGLSGLLQQMNNPEEIAEIAQLINRSATSLVDEIKSQRYLSEAERNSYVPEYSKVNSLEILQSLYELYSQHEVVADKQIKIDSDSEDINFETDVVLLRRILGNMIKNALEASFPKGTVKIKSTSGNNNVQFSVHNNNFIQREIQLQLFKRSFSTKGAGRGIGTYSMKLFGEKYLKGKVWFESGTEKGTTFFIQIPHGTC